MIVSRTTIILTHSNMPKTEDAIDTRNNVRCPHCGAKLGEARDRVLIVANTRGPAFKEVPIGVAMFEIKCPKCNTISNIIWQ